MSHHDIDYRTDEFDGRPELVKKRARTILIQRLAWIVVGVYLFISLSILTANAIASFQTRAKLYDCVQPSGDCYQNGQQSQGGIINDLVHALNAAGENRADDTRQYFVYVAACTTTPGNGGNADAIEKCANAMFAQYQKEVDKNGNG